MTRSASDHQKASSRKLRMRLLNNEKTPGLGEAPARAVLSLHVGRRDHDDGDAAGGDSISSNSIGWTRLKRIPGPINQLSYKRLDGSQIPSVTLITILVIVLFHPVMLDKDSCEVLLFEAVSRENGMITDQPMI